MPRLLRLQFPGAYYHVMARGNRRERIFFDDLDRHFFVRTLGEACAKTGWRVCAWVLMSNHYHLMLQTPEANLVAGMQWLQNTLTRRFNVRHRKWGRLFGDRYKAIVVEGESEFYYQTLLDYIHLNPVRVGLIKPAEKQSVLDYPWSSVAGGYALPESKRVQWLAVSEGLAAFGLRDTVAGRREFAERLDRRAVEEGMKRAGIPLLDREADARCSHLRRGWFWGRQQFAEKMLALLDGKTARTKARAYRSAPVQKAHSQRQATTWLRQGLVAAGFRAGELERCQGSDPRKIALARLLWERTTVSQSWLAEHLHMASAANVSQQLRRSPGSLKDVPEALRAFLHSV